MLHFRGGRAGISKEALPRARARVLRRRRQGLRRRAALAGRGRLHLRADGRHQPRLPVRREDARGRARRAATTRTSCRTATPTSSTSVVAQKPAGHDAGDAPVPRQLQEHARGRRAATSRWPRRCSSEMNVDAYFLEYDDERSRRLPAAALPAQGQDRGARPGHHQVRRAREARTTSSAASTRPRSTCRWSSWRCRRNAASRAAARQQHRGEPQRAKLRLVVRHCARSLAG